LHGLWLIPPMLPRSVVLVLRLQYSLNPLSRSQGYCPAHGHIHAIACVRLLYSAIFARVCMFHPLSLAIGLRYTRARRRNHFVSFISLVSMLGLILGVSVLILVLSVMNGFDREMRERILGVIPHVSVYGKNPIGDWQGLANELKAQPQVVDAAPFVNMQGMAAVNGEVSGILVNGIDPAFEPRVSIIADFVEDDALASLRPGEFGVILGDLLAARLEVFPGDSFTLVLPEAHLSPAGIIPRIKQVRVLGMFSLGSELDANMAMMHYLDVARLKGLGESAEGVRLKVDDLFNAPRIMWDVLNQLGGAYQASNWTSRYGNLFQSIKLEKRMVGLLLFLIIAVAAFNIVATLVMVVTDKRGDIAILRTLGCSSGAIVRIFIVQGATIGLVGTLLGAALGVVAALNVSDFVQMVESMFGTQFLSADTYFISYLPSQLIWSDVAQITVAAFFLTLLATIYPALRAARVEPAEALRYE